jgi:photosystem II stability/assembly factor-like uncharacterized protein
MDRFRLLVSALSFAVVMYLIGCKRDDVLINSVPDSYNWIHLSSAPQITSNCFLSRGDTLFVGTVSGIYISVDTGTTWRHIGYGQISTAPVFSIRSINGKLFAGTGIRRGLFSSSSNGYWWELADSGLPNSSPISLIQIDSLLFTGLSDSGVYVSNDFGVSWYSANTEVFLEGTDVRAFASSSGDLFAATFGSGVFKTSNRGESWSGVGIPNGFTLSLIVHAETLFVGTDNGGLRTTNGGLSWASPIQGLPRNNRVNSLLDVGTHWFAGSDSGIYRSTDAGVSWSSISYGLPVEPLVNAVVVHKGYVFIATAIDGIWKSKLTNLTKTIVTE